MWWKNAVIYEVYVDKFAKNFEGMAEKLPYLKTLGINCIWLLPHYPSPMIDDGYDVSDYLNVRPELGTLDDFKQFTKKAHENGIRVIVDLVINHVSVEHPWFRERKDFFLWSKTGKEFPQAVNPFSYIKPSNWIFNKERGEYYFATFYSQQADLNWDNQEVFNEMMKVIDFWMTHGVDGFRLDAAPFLIKREGTLCVNLPEIHAVFKKIRAHIEKKSLEVILLAETNGPLDKVKEYFGSGDECHMAFHFHLMSAMFLALKRGDISIAKKMAGETSNIPQNCQWATFLRNHDELTLEHIGSKEQDELMRWLDPKDQYSFRGGYGASVRLAAIFNGDKAKILEALNLLFKMPGSPVIYYGDEIGMENLKLAEKPADTRKYVRGEFDWKEVERQMGVGTSLFNEIAGLIRNRGNPTN